MSIELICGDCLEWMKKQPDNSIDLIFGSPPYENRRKYSELNFNLIGQKWVDFITERWIEMNRICKGLVAMVVEGKTSKFQWSATPALLMSDLHRMGLKLRKPPIYERDGIPGSGGPEWLKNRYEFIVCTSKGRFPWSDVKSIGHKLKYPHGGKLSYRDVNGVRRHKIGGTSGYSKGDALRYKASENNLLDRAITEIANPGNVFKCSSGGGHLGNKLAHENEAPFPEKLVEPFVKAFCPKNGITLDPFCGSSTTGAMCLKHNRNYIGIDIRESQIELSKERLGIL